MKYNILVMSLVLGTALTGLNPTSAFARKLDLASLQGKYEYVPTSDTSLMCPDTITVTYDAANAAFDSEIFHFANIGRRASGPSGIDTDPEAASFSEAFTVTKLTKNSVREEKINQSTTSDMSGFPMSPGPMDAINPGSPESMHLIDSESVLTTEVKYDSKTHILKKTVDIDGMNTGDNCAYQKI